MTKKPQPRSTKKTIRPVATPTKLGQAATPAEPTVFELRARVMPTLQAKAQAAPEPEAGAETEEAAFQPLSEKDVILRLVEMLKGL